MKFATLILLALSSVAFADTDQETFEKYCSSCHTLPDLLTAPEVPPYMFDYVRAFGATDVDIAAIQRWLACYAKHGSEITFVCGE